MIQPNEKLVIEKIKKRIETDLLKLGKLNKRIKPPFKSAVHETLCALEYKCKQQLRLIEQLYETEAARDNPHYASYGEFLTSIGPEMWTGHFE